MTLKHKLLDYFMNKKNIIISGQDLAATFSVTRSAIWKVIEELRDQGYTIESLPSKGYRYTRSSTDLDSQQLSKVLDKEWDGLPIQIYDEVTSTNDVAKIYAVNRPNESAYIIAGKQLKGRGRYGKTFHSELKNGLYSSLLVPIKNTKLEHIPLITIATATAISRAFETVCGKELQIKWVNDLFYNGRKVSGILCEAISDMESGEISSVVIGVGLNLAGNFDETEDIVRKVAGTIFGEQLPETLNLNDLLGTYLNYLKGYLDNLEKKEFIQYYTDHLLGIDNEVSYKVGKEFKHGIIRGINDNGHLLVEQSDGQIDELFGQEIHLSSQQFTTGD